MAEGGRQGRSRKRTDNQEEWSNDAPTVTEAGKQPSKLKLTGAGVTLDKRWARPTQDVTFKIFELNLEAYMNMTFDWDDGLPTEYLQEGMEVTDQSHPYHRFNSLMIYNALVRATTGEAAEIIHRHSTQKCAASAYQELKRHYNKADPSLYYPIQTKFHKIQWNGLTSTVQQIKRILSQLNDMGEDAKHVTPKFS